MSGDQPKDPYEHIIQILRREQATPRLRLGIDLTLTDINAHLLRDIRQDLYMCCKNDDPEKLSKLLEEHELSLDHRCLYVNRTEHGDHRGDGVPGFGWQLEPAYHRAYDSTLLHAASWFGSNKVMTWLLERGADADVREILHRNAKDVAGSDPIKLLLHTRTLGRVWQNTDDPYEMDKRFASYSNWRKKKKRSGAPVWKPADSRQKTALERRLLGAYRVEKIEDNSQAEADAKSFLRRKGDGGSKVTDVVEAKTNVIGDPGHHIDKTLMANKYLKK